MACTEIEAQRDALFALLRERGAKLIGTASLEGVAEDANTTGLAVAVPVPKHIVEDLKTAPTKEYADMYGILNDRLDDIVLAGEAFLKKLGYTAEAHTVAATKSNSAWRTKLPHKTVATRAGLGWIGKSCLLVTPEYGSAIRLSSLVTNAPLPAGKPITESRCGACDICVRSCPAKALSGALWEAGMERDKLLNTVDCEKKQRERMREATGVDRDLCGLCFAVCPYTARYLKSAAD